jgi:hypothetical protein
MQEIEIIGKPSVFQWPIPEAPSANLVSITPR